MKILFADKFPESFLKGLENAGHDCTIDPNLTVEDLPQAVGDSEILVVRSTRVTNLRMQRTGQKRYRCGGIGYRTAHCH